MGYVRVQLPRGLIVLTRGELEYMLRYHPTIYHTALTRGRDANSVNRRKRGKRRTSKE